MGNEVQTQVSLSCLLGSESVKKRFSDMLGDKAPAFISSILTAVSLNSALGKCDPQSVLAAAAIAASLDLPINQSLGMAHIVPYSGKAQFQLGWKGFIQLAQRTGQYKLMNVCTVHEGDIKSINRFTGEIEFNENQISKFEDRPVVGYLFYFRLVTGYEKYFYMSKAECEAHGKKYSKSYATGNWKNDFDGMARKTVVKMALSKYGILTTEMNRAITADQGVINDDGEVVEYPDNDPGTSLSVDAEVVVEQTHRQRYETLKLQLITASREKYVADLVNDHSEMSKHAEKDFDDSDLKYCIGEMEKELAKK